MITEKISNSGVLSGTINASSNLAMEIGSSNSLVGGNINTFTKETDPTIPDYIKAISKEDIAGWDNNAVVNEEQNKTLMGLEELIDTITPKAAAKGELVHITDALGLPTFETKASGNVKQETTKGQQLFDYKDTVTISAEVTTDEDDWITMTYDNINGTTTKYLNLFTNRSELLKENTEYRIIVEIKNITQTNVVPGSYLTLIGIEAPTQFAKNIAFPIYLSKKGTFAYSITTKESFEETTMMTRNFLAIGVGDSVSVTFRLSVLEDTTVTPETFVYEKYTGGIVSPNLDYPQEVEVLEAHNKFNINTITENKYIDGSNGEIANSSASNISDYIEIKANEKFTLFYKYDSLANTGNRTIAYYDVEKNFLNGFVYNPVNKPITFTTPNDTNFVRFSYDKNIYDIQLVKGIKEKPYNPYSCVSYKVIGNNFCKTTDCNISDTNYSCIIQNGEIEINSTNTNNNFDICGGVRTGEWIQGYEKATDYFLTPKGGTYAIKLFIDEISGSGNGSNQLIIHTNKQKIIRYFSTTTTAVTAKISLENDEYIKQVAIWTNGTLIIKIKGKVLLEQDSITSWEAYKEQIIPLDLKGNFIGKIKDTDIEDYLVTDKKRLWLVKNVAKDFLTDTNVNKRITEYNGLYWVGIKKPKNSKMIGNWKRYKLVVNCAFYSNIREKEFSYQTLIGTNDWGIIVNSTETIENIRPKILGGYYYYELAEPQIIDLGELPEPIKTFEGVNNIHLLTNIPTEIEVKYALDIKKYADDRHLELTNALVSTGANL